MERILWWATMKNEDYFNLSMMLNKNTEIPCEKFRSLAIEGKNGNPPQEIIEELDEILDKIK